MLSPVLTQAALESVKDTQRKNRTRSISLSTRDMVKPHPLLVLNNTGATADDMKLPSRASSSGVRPSQSTTGAFPRFPSTNGSDMPSRRPSEFSNPGSNSDFPSTPGSEDSGDSRSSSPVPHPLGSMAHRRLVSNDEMALTSEAHEKLTYGSAHA